MRELKVGDTLRQSLSGYPGTEIFTVLAILWENEEEIKVIAFWFGDLPGIFEETIQKKYIRQQHFRGSMSILRTDIL